MGDPKQLPATVKSLVAQKLSLARSLFERLQVPLQACLLWQEYQHMNRAVIACHSHRSKCLKRLTYCTIYFRQSVGHIVDVLQGGAPAAAQMLSVQYRMHPFIREFPSKVWHCLSRLALEQSVHDHICSRRHMEPFVCA